MRIAKDSPNGLASVIIPTFNRRPFLVDVITPLLIDPGTGEVIVVVDGSNDGSFELLEEWAKQEPRLRPLYQENSGQGDARRRGIEEARFNVVVLLDDDVVAGAGLISAHAHWHANDERLVVLGYMPATVPMTPRRDQVALILYGADYESACRLYEAKPQLILSHLWSGNMSLRRANALEVGAGSLPRVTYHEDLRFGLQCQEAGLHAVFDRSLRATHLYRRTLRQFAADCRRSGVARAQLGREFPQMADSMNPLTTTSARDRFITRYLGSPYVRPVSAPIATATSQIAGRLGAWRWEKNTARVLQLIEMSYGYRRDIAKVTR